MDVDWAGQLAALARDEYRGRFTRKRTGLGRTGDKLAGSVICGRHLRDLIAHAH